MHLGCGSNKSIVGRQRAPRTERSGSFDHRLIDGASASQFMAQVKQNLETWDAEAFGA